MKIVSSLFCLTAFIFIASCDQNDKEGDRQLLLDSNEIQKIAHLENDAAMLVSQIADTMIQVAGGEVKKASNEQVKDRFTNYFDKVKYRRWDDLQPPIIEIASSGDLATVTVHKVIETKPMNTHDSLYRETTFAWTAIYKKYSGQWKISTNISTRKIVD